jgi:hypothetical protein
MEGKSKWEANERKSSPGMQARIHRQIGRFADM